MFTLVCALVFGQVSSTPFIPPVPISPSIICPCGVDCKCTANNNCGCISQHKLVKQQSQQGNFCGPNGCSTQQLGVNNYLNPQYYGCCANGSCANANVNANTNTCGPNGCSNVQANNRFYNYPRYQTRTYRRFRIFRRW